MTLILFSKIISKKILIASTISSALFLGACATGDKARTKNGALVGAVIGAAAGSTSSDDKGALYGAVAGALIGSAVGNYLDQQQREIEEELATEIQANEVAVERLEDDTLRVSLTSEATFDVDSSALKPSFYPSLDRLGGLMDKYDQTILHIIGHTDSTGSNEYNNVLSRKRAVSVATYVRDNGVDRSRINVEGRGELEPRAVNDTVAGRRANRRVEIYIRPIIEDQPDRARESPEYT